MEQYRWSVMCFIGYTADDTDEICYALEVIGCNGHALESASKHLSLASEERGLTYSNVGTRESVVAVGASDNKGNLVNTIGHELLHVVAHICDNDNITMQSEEPCYIMGELCEQLFNSIK
uniref:hypothetical protein n=1 Tax=Prevotella sp. TaxID=59823 RepID=UPI0040283E1D